MAVGEPEILGMNNVKNERKFDVLTYTVVMRASTMVKLSWRTLARGARQLVVQEALEMTVSAGLYLSRFTPEKDNRFS